MKHRFLPVLVLLTLTVSAVFAQENPPVTESRGYLVGPGDVLTIKVLGEQQFGVEAVTVDEDGKIEVPFARAPVIAKCRTEKELRAEITKLLTVYLRNPQATVYVKERNSRPPVAVYGEVKQNQRINLTRKATLQDLLAFSGGVTEKAGGLVQITRTQPLLCEEGSDDDWKSVSENSNGASFPSRLYSLGSLRDINPTVYPGDIVFIQEAARVYVIGEVRQAGEIRIPEGGLPLTRAVAMVAGMTREAQKKDIKVYRRKPGNTEPELILVNFDQVRAGTQKDPMLEPNDIVEVGKAPDSFWNVMRDIITGSARNLSNLPLVAF
jgi:protein involved in polysaccharide export with SLBB domain